MDKKEPVSLDKNYSESFDIIKYYFAFPLDVIKYHQGNRPRKRKIGKLCKKIFEEDYEQESQKNEEEDLELNK